MSLMDKNDNNSIRIIVFGDSIEIATAIAKSFNQAGYKIQATNTKTINDLKAKLKTQEWDIILCGSKCIENYSEDIISLLARNNQDTSFLAVTDNEADNIILNALRLGVRDILFTNKPELCQLIIKRELGDLASRRAHRHFEALHKEHTQLHEKSSNINKQDLLTGVFRQDYFLNEVNKSLATTSGKLATHGLIYIELDNFIDIKIKVGAAASDLIIKNISHSIKNAVDPSTLIARLHDAVFTAQFVNIPKKDIKESAEKIRNIIANLKHNIEGHSIPDSTCSIGISLYDNPDLDAGGLLLHAQVACEIAKSNNGNTIHLYTHKTDSHIHIEGKTSWEDKIKHALENDRFQLAFLPIVNLHKEPAENYELLIRMIGSNNEEILPGEFMTDATQAGLMTNIDRWVVNRAIQILSTQRKTGTNTSFFIKLSSDTFGDPSFPNWLSEKLGASALPADSLVFEICESAIIKQPDKAKELIDTLKSIHCRIALDHFGTEKDSLERMKQLPVDVIKIDRSFIENLSSNTENKDKVKLIVGTAHLSNIIVIAEFVQDAYSLSTLWQCGLDYIQGYFLQRPDATMAYDFSDGAF